MCNTGSRKRPSPRFVFVAGLHRTGTSLVAKLLASHPQISGIEASGAPEDEGCYLQGAIPHTALDGMPGHYATDPKQHLIEGGRFDTVETRDRLLSDWSKWFEPRADWWVEKSPVNLLRMRLYQQLFPMSHFVVVLRHPAIMAEALRKWTDRPTAELVDYGLSAYELAQADLPYVHCALVLRYEDLIAEPERIRAALFAFLDLPDHNADIEIRDGNADYRTRHRSSAREAERLAVFGYGQGGTVQPFAPIVRHPLRRIREQTEALLSG